MQAFHQRGFRAIAQASAEDDRDVLPHLDIPTVAGVRRARCASPADDCRGLQAARASRTRRRRPRRASRPHWSRKRCRGISTAQEATCASRPSARRARADVPANTFRYPKAATPVRARSPRARRRRARASARAPSRRSRPRRSGRAVRSPLHQPSCTTSHLAIAAGTLPTRRRESSSAGAIASSRNGFVTSGVASTHHRVVGRDQ